MALCPNGHENPDGAKFCNECGAPMAPVAAVMPPAGPPPPPPRSTPPPKRSFWKRPIGIAVIVFVTLVVLGGIVGRVPSSGGL
jgi:hypothetical protein